MRSRMFSEQWFQAVRQNRELARSRGNRKIMRRTGVALAVGQTLYLTGEAVVSPAKSLWRRITGGLRYLISIIAV